MTALLVGYARCSTEQQDLTVQREGLLALGVDPGRAYVDHGLTGTNRDRPGLREALAACREGDTLVVTKLDRLARSLPDARAIADELTARQVRLNLGGSVYDPNDAVGRLLFNVLAMVAEFESDLIRLRTREGMKIAKAKGRLRGRQPKLNARQEAHLMTVFQTGEHSTGELDDLFGVGRSTVYRAIERQRAKAPTLLERGGRATVRSILGPAAELHLADVARGFVHLVVGLPLRVAARAEETMGPSVATWRTATWMRPTGWRCCGHRTTRRFWPSWGRGTWATRSAPGRRTSAVWSAGPPMARAQR